MCFKAMTRFQFHVINGVSDVEENEKMWDYNIKMCTIPSKSIYIIYLIQISNKICRKYPVKYISGL